LAGTAGHTAATVAAGHRNRSGRGFRAIPERDDC
jgi:hypothetical protein